MLPETLAHLKEHDFLRGEEQVNRDGLADATLALLLERPVETTDDVQDKALIVPEIRHRILGAGATEEIDAELDGILASLTGPRGPVQEKLDSGMVLCSATVTRRLSNNGEGEIVIKRVGRFVTPNEDLIERHFWFPQEARLVSAARRYQERLTLAIERRPAMAARRPAQISRAHQQLALELPTA